MIAAGCPLSCPICCIQIDEEPEFQTLSLNPGLGNVASRPMLTYAVSRMTNLLLILFHLAVMTAKLCGPGGMRAVIAENLVLKQQLTSRFACRTARSRGRST
jgi:hypothetical protein